MPKTTSGRAVTAGTTVVAFEPKRYVEALRDSWSSSERGTGAVRGDKGAEAFFDFCVEGALYAGSDLRAVAPPSTSAECMAGRQAWLQLS